jgi:hypothetical protein
MEKMRFNIKEIGIKRILKFFAFVILAIIIAYLVITIVYVTMDWKTGFLNINPPEQTHIIQRHFDVPTVEPPFSVTKANEQSSEGQLLSADVFFQYKGILAEGIPVEINTTGLLYTEGQKENVNNAIVGFDGAMIYNASNYYVPNGQTPIHLLKSDSHSIIVKKPPQIMSPSDIDETIEWDTQGDYPPFLVVTFTNKTPLTIWYPNQKIHISGSDIVRQEKYSLINTRLSIAIFWLTLMTSLSMLCKFAPKMLSWFCSENKTNKPDNNISDTPEKEKPKNQ